MLLPPGFAEFFVLEGVTPAALCAYRAGMGLECDLRGEFIGYQVVPMGWSWAVFFAETCMTYLTVRDAFSMMSMRSVGFQAILAQARSHFGSSP